MVINNILPTSEGFNIILINALFAIGTLLFGILLGKFVSYLLEKVIKKLDIKNKAHYGFAGLVVVAIRWSIYIGFLSIALSRLNIPFFTDVLTKMLVAIPAFTGALILIGIGFAIATYLKNTIDGSEIEELKTLSKYVYYFVLYIFGVYALNLALISTDDIVRNSIIISLTVIIITALTYTLVKKRNIN